MRKFLLFITALLITYSVQAQVSLLGQDVFELDATVKKDTINVPLKFDSLPKKQKPTLLSDVPFTVRLGANKLDNQYRNAIRIFVNPGDEPFLNIAVDLLKLNTAGTYEVKIAYKTGEGDMKLFTVSLIRPAAIVDTLSTVHININGYKITCDSLIIKETSGVSDINNAKLTTPFFTGVNRNNLISFSFATCNIPAGKISTVSYRPNEKLLHSLPLGKTSGKMLVKTPEMSTSLTVPFEIMNKRSKCWILVVLFGGLLLGAFVRHLLKDKKEWEGLKIQGLQLIQKISEEMKKVGDEGFRKEIADLLQDLYTCLDSKGGWAYFSSTPDIPLADKIKATETAYNTKKTAFDARITAQKEILKQLSGCFENHHLSDTIKSLLADALVTYNNAKISLDKLDVTNMEIAIQQTIDEIKIVLKPFTDYQRSLTTLMLNDGFYPITITQDVKTFVKKYITQIQDALAKIKVNSTDPKVLTEEINTADQIVELKGNMLDYINRSFSDIYDLDTAVEDSPEVVAFKNVFAQWSAVLKNIIQNPKDYSDAEEYWSSQLVDALNKAWSAIKLETVMGDEVVKQIAGDGATRPNKQPFTPSDYFNEGGAGLASIFTDIERAKKNKLIYSLLQTFLLAVVLGLIAFNFYGPSFIGTLNELTTIFLFAFFFDISLDRIMELKTGKIPS